MSHEYKENNRYERKIAIIFLNLVIVVTLSFASYGVYCQNYTQHSNIISSPGTAVETLAAKNSSYSLGNLESPSNTGQLLVVKGDSQQATTANTVVIEPINIVLYRFAESTPQPMTYYTDLLEIRNTANTSATMDIRVENIHGQENLGCIHIWLFENQTQTPTTDTPIASLKITNLTADSADLIANYSLKANSTNYIELAGFASLSAIDGSQISFDFAIREYE